VKSDAFSNQYATFIPDVRILFYTAVLTGRTIKIASLFALLLVRILCPEGHRITLHMLHQRARIPVQPHLLHLQARRALPFLCGPDNGRPRHGYLDVGVGARVAFHPDLPRPAHRDQRRAVAVGNLDAVLERVRYPLKGRKELPHPVPHLRRTVVDGAVCVARKVKFR
jgi:hypothetical protein